MLDVTGLSLFRTRYVALRDAPFACLRCHIVPPLASGVGENRTAGTCIHYRAIGRKKGRVSTKHVLRSSGIDSS